MIQMTVRTFAEYCGGKLVSGDPDTRISSVSTDSRTTEEGALFVPVVGERSDGHRFLRQAEDRKASAALFMSGNPAALDYIAERKAEEASGSARNGMALIEVGDSVGALQAAAAAYRRTLNIPIVGVTGSVGKTTTREMIAAALSASFRVYRTAGNHNSQIGVPITVLDIDPASCDIAVVEMGMSIPGEMQRIAAVVKPDAAVFTNIGDAHIEQLKSREGILKEKLRMTDGMPEGAPVFLNGEDPLLSSCRLRKDLKRVLYGGAEGAVRAEDVDLSRGFASFTAVSGEERIPVLLHVYGGHMVLNALAALAVTAHFGGSLTGAAKALSEFSGYRHRQQIFLHNGITVVDDSYNASPDSMRAAVRVLGQVKCSGRRFAVLADMLELGPCAPAMHAGIGEVLGREKCADVLFTLGTLSKEIERTAAAADPSLTVRHFDDRASLEEALFAELKPGDAVLFKGSNSMGLSAAADRFSGL